MTRYIIIYIYSLFAGCLMGMKNVRIVSRMFCYYDDMLLDDLHVLWTSTNFD